MEMVMMVVMMEMVMVVVSLNMEIVLKETNFSSTPWSSKTVPSWRSLCLTTISTLSRNEDKFNDAGCETITNLPRGTTAGIPTGETVIIVMVEPVWVASADWVFVFTDPNVAWKSLLLLLLRLLLLFTITLLTWAVCRTVQYQ